jgi:hypothetical protein
MRAVAVLIAATVMLGIGMTVASASGRSSQLDGTLLVAHGDDFTHGHSTTMQLSLRTAGGEIPLRAASVPHAQLLALAGRRVRVQGTRAGATINASGLTALGGVLPTLGQPGKPLRIAYVLMHPVTSPAKPLSTSAAEAVMFTGKGSVAAWYAQASYGQLQITGKVFGSYDTTLPVTTCSIYAWTGAAYSAMQADPAYKGEQYDDIIVQAPFGCSFGGLAYIGSAGAIVSGNFDFLIEHELGHNLGLGHANAYHCDGQAFSTANCQWEEYGDSYDVMGRGSRYQFNAEHKRELGWIPPSAIATATPGTHTFELTASEIAPSAGSTQVLEIPRPDGTRYAIERREPIGVDAQKIMFSDGIPFPSVQGVWVRVAQGGANGGSVTALVDMSAQGGDSDGRLRVGQTFADAASQVKITTLSTDGITSKVQVCMGPCGGYVAPPPPDQQVYVESHEGAVFVDGTPHDDVIHVVANGKSRTADANGKFVRAEGPFCTSDGKVATCTAPLWFDVFGEDGNDTLQVSGTQRAILVGGNGDDLLIGGPKKDWFIGGAGDDTADLRAVHSVRDQIDPDVEHVLR